MNRAEVIDLMVLIKRTYPSFDTGRESVDHHCKYLQDYLYAAALENVERHIMTERWPPTIADIRGRLGDKMDSQRSKEEAEAYFAQVELWRQNSSPPPAGYWEMGRAVLRGEHN